MVGEVEQKLWNTILSTKYISSANTLVTLTLLQDRTLDSPHKLYLLSEAEAD